jgi:hypothetical protein
MKYRSFWRVAVSATVSGVLASAADWPMRGGGPQRNGWARDARENTRSISRRSTFCPAMDSLPEPVVGGKRFRRAFSAAPFVNYYQDPCLSMGNMPTGVCRVLRVHDAEDYRDALLREACRAPCPCIAGHRLPRLEQDALTRPGPAA